MPRVGVLREKRTIAKMQLMRERLKTAERASFCFVGMRLRRARDSGISVTNEQHVSAMSCNFASEQDRVAY